MDFKQLLGIKKYLKRFLGNFKLFQNISKDFTTFQNGLQVTLKHLSGFLKDFKDARSISKLFERF